MATRTEDINSIRKRLAETGTSRKYSRASEEDLKKFYDTVQNNINYWMDVGNSFVDSTNSYYNNLDTSTYGLNSSNLWKNSATARSNWLTKEADNIDKILTEYGRYFDSDWISNVRSAMSSVKGASDSILKQADKDIEYWQSWDEVGKKTGMTAEEAYMNSYFTDKYSGYSYEDINKTIGSLLKDGGGKPGEAEWLAKNSDSFMSSAEAQAEMDALNEKYKFGNENWLESTWGNIVNTLDKTWNGEQSARARYQELQTIKSNAERKEKLSQMVSDARADTAYGDYVSQGKAWGLQYTVVEKEEEGYSWTEKVYNDALVGDRSGDGFSVKLGNFVKHMTDDEYNDYLYLLGKYGKDTAQEYLDLIEVEVNTKEAYDIRERLDNPVARHLQLPQIFSLYAGLDQFGSGIKGLFSDGYEAPSEYQLAQGLIREDQNAGGKIAMDLGQTTGNMLPSILASAIATYALGPAGGAAVFGATGAKAVGGAIGTFGVMMPSAAGNARQEMLNLGYSEAQANTYGALTGISEASLQYLLGGIGKLGSGLTDDAIKSFANGFNSAGAKFAIEFGADIAGEALEEALQEVLDPFFKSFATGQKFEGIDWGQVAYSGFLGALSAGVLNGMGEIGTRASELSIAKDIKGNENKINAFKEIASKQSVSNLAQKLASKIDTNTGAWKIADLIHEMNGTLSEQNVADIKYQLERSGVLPKDAQTIAEYLGKAVDGDLLTAKQRKALDTNPIISRVFKKVVLDQNSTVNQRLNALMDIYGQSGHAGVDYAELAKAQSNKGLSESATFNQYVEGAKKEAIKSKYGIGRSESTNAMLDSMVAETKALMHNAKVNEGGKTTDTTTGKEVTIKKVKDAKAKMLELADGSTINSKSIEYSNDDEAILYETVLSRGYDTDTANAVISGIKAAEGLSVTQYLNGVDEAIEYGKIGYPMEKISTDGFYADLSDSMKKFAYNLGKDIATKETASAQARVDGAKGKVIKTRSGNVIIDEDIKGMTSRQEASITTLGKMVTDITHSNVHIFESVEKVINGKKVRVFAKDTAGFKAGTNADNGFYDKSTGDIYIDLHAGANAEGVILWTAAHELTHFIHQWSPAKFKVLADFLMAEYGKQGVDIQTLIDNKIAESKRKKLTRDEAYEEVVADAMQSMFTDTNLASKVEKLKNTDKGLWNKIKQFFRDLYKRITKEYEGLEAQTWEDHFVRQMSKDTIGRLSDLFAEALVDAGDTYANVDIDAVASGEVMYSPRGDVLSWDIAWDSDNHSSIKEQLKAHLDEVNSMQPVASVNYDKTKGKPYYEQLDEILRTKFGYKIERQDHGSITFDKDAIKGARGYVDSDAEAAALIVAPYILKRGKAISGHKDHKGKGYPSIVYAAPATLNGEVGNVAVSVLYGGARRVHSLRVLTPSGKEFILAKIKNTEPTTSGASPKSDVEPTISPVLSGNRIAQNPDSVNSSEKISFSERKEAPPTKTEKAYKLMRLSNGKLYPLFIGNNEEVRVGTWYNADSPNLSQLKNLAPGTHLVDMKTGEAMTWDEYAEKHVPKKNGKPKRSKPNIDDVHWANDNGYRFMHIEEKAGGKSETEMVKKYGDTRAYYNWGVNGSSKTESGEGSASLYALRPGWHFGEVPSMHQIGYDGENGDTVRLDNQVWVEVEMSADVDYNAEAASNWGGDIPTHIPTNGYYKFATNPTQKKTKGGNTEADLTKSDWYVAGAFKVNRILSDSEADSIVENYNKINGKNVPLDYRRNYGRVFNAETMSLEDRIMFSERGSTIYIKDGHTEDGGTVDFINLILDGKKKGETRTHKNLTRKWVGIAKDGKVYGRVRFGEPYLIDKNSPEYKDSYIEGTEYDLKDNEQKYYYPIVETEDFRDAPKPIEKNGNYGTYSYSERILMGSLFSGGGTLEAGLTYQMLDKQFGVEYDGKIASVYADNHGDHIQVGRVEDFDISKYKDIFYLHASPVCHNFSKAKHGAKELQMDIDSAKATAKHLETAMPQVFTVENAPGYRKSQSLKIITDKLTELGYKWDVDVYNSADYGSATSRNRVILRAVKDGELPAKPTKQERTNSWDKVTRDLWNTLPKSDLRPSFISAIENTPSLPILDANGKVNVNKPLLILTTTNGHQVTYCWEGEICPTLTTKCGEAKLVMPDGNIYAVTPEFMGRIQGLPNDYKYPKEKTRAFTIIGNGIPTHLTKAVIGGVLDSAYEQTHNGDILFSERTDNAIDNRSLLANALESVAQNDVEKSWLAKYKAQIADLNEKQNKLAEIRAEIQKTRFTKGADRSKLTELENNAKTLANQINRADKKLLELEASKALKGVVDRERAKAYQLGKAKVDEYRKDRAESTARSYYTPRIEKVVSDLRNRLEHPSAKNAIPEAFGASVAKVLSAFNFTTYDKDGKPRPSKANMSRAESQMALVELANQLSQNSLESQYGQLDIPPEMLEWIKEMTTYFEAASNLASEEFTINKMNEVQLKNIYKFLRSLQTTINKAGKYYTNASYDVASDAKSTMEHLAPLPSQASDRGQLLSKMLAWDLASPVTVFDRFGEGGKHVYNMLIKGQSKEAYNVQKILDFVDKAYTAKEAKEWRETLVPITIDGKEYKVTIAYLMGLHCLLKQEDSKRHILEGGGIRFGDVKHKGKTTRFTDTFFKEADAIEVENILDKYPRAREVAEAMQKFMEETGSAWGNEVSMIRFGYHAFTIKGYYPIRTIAAGSEYEAQQKRANIYALLNKSFTKERTPGANNVVIVDDIFSVFNNHMSEMALYNAWAMPVIDAIKWFNYRESQDVLVEKSEKSVHESLRLAYGNNADEYVRRLFESINGQKGGGLSEALASYMLRKVNRVAVAGNLRVAIQQPFSVVRAYELINAKYVTPLLGKARDVAYEEMLANSGIAKWKSMGYYDVNVSMPLESKVFKNETLSDKATDKLMKAAEDGDAFTWAMLWNACKKETKEKNPKLEGEELLKKTAERFDDLVLRTQVVDSVLAKSQWMRSSGFFHKSSSSFMSEPLTSYNALLRQYDKYSRDLAMHGAKYATKNNIKGIGKAMSIYVLAQVVNAIATAPLDAMRDDDDYETYLEKLLAHFKDNAVSNLMPWNMLPWISDIADYFIYGRLDRPDLALATNVIDFAKSIDKTIDNYSYYKLHNTFKQGLEVSSQISGLPVSNLWRDAVSIWNTVVSPFGYGELKFQTQADKASVAYKKMYDALFNGNEDRAENLYGQLMSNGVDVDKVYSGVSNLIKEDVKNGNITTEEAIERMMTLLGFTGKTDSDGKPITENDVYWQVDKWNYTNENGGNSEGYSKYDDIFTAMEEGDPTSAIEWHIENKMNVYLEEAKAKAEEEGKYFNEVKAKREAKSKAESAIKSAITSYWKPLYKEAYKNKNDEEMKRIRYMLKATKLYGTTSELLDTVKGWLKD